MPHDTRPSSPDAAKPISRRLRFEILRRDGNQCTYCGRKPPEVALTVDHVIPRALGGGDEPSNLATACRDCNSGKSSTSPDEVVVAEVDAKAVEWSRALTAAADRRRSEVSELAASVAAFDAVWMGWSAAGKAVVRQDDWRQSIETFVAAGLNADDLAHFVDVTMRSKAALHAKWRYMCGCCWNEIKRRQELALQIVGGVVDGDQDIASAAIDEAEERAYNEGYDEGYEAGRMIAGARDTEDERVSYEAGFRHGSERTIQRWRREHPEDFAPSEDMPTAIQLLRQEGY